MRLVVTGASGFIGKQLVPQLLQQGASLLLVGRQPDLLQSQFPGCEVAGYEGISARAVGYDAVVHLAVRNNDQPGSLEDFRAVNVTLLDEVVQAARAAGIKTFINMATMQANLAASASAYGRSKAEGEALLAAIIDMHVVTLRLPAVYGSEYRGKLAVLNRLPSVLRPAAFSVLASLKPTAHIDRAGQAIIAAVNLQQTATLIVSDRQEKNLFFSFFKRSMDLAFVLFVVVFLFWLLLAAWIAVKLSGKGPAIFAQTRVGRHQREFKCYKFRTMAVGTQQVGTHEVNANAITKVGAFLRKTKIDELPQIVNILKNEVSLIGPRPCLPQQTELIEARERLGVYKVVPGITGWAQIQNIDMSTPQKLAQTDADYIALRTIPMELKILLKTARGGGQGDKVKK